VYAYLADVTVREERGQAYAQMSGMVFLALTIGPAISAVSSMWGSFIIAASLSLLNLLYCFFIMPESLPSLVYHPLDAASSPLTSPPPPAQRLTPFSTLTFMFRSRLYFLIFLMVLLEQLAVYGIGEIFLLYLMDTLGFRRRDNIHLGIAQGIASILVMLVLLPLLSPRLGEKRIIILSLCLYLLYTALYPFVTTRGEVYSLITLSSLSTMSYPATSSLLSIHSPSSEQGLSQGALSGIRSLALGVGPLLFALVFAFFTRHDAVQQRPWVPFILAAALTAMSLVVASKLPKRGAASKSGGQQAAEDGEVEDEENAELERQQQQTGGYGAVDKRDGLYDDVDDMKELDERQDALRPLRP
jgi:DHA1 family tetracycline resistance protein-like MFS transporter